jgi:O-antigen ligase
MQKYIRVNFILSLLTCAIPISLVVGAAVLEFCIFISCLLFFYINWKKLGLNYYKNNFSITFFVFCLFLIFGSLTSDYVSNSIRNSIFYFRFGILTLIIWYLLDYCKNFKFFFFVSLAATLSVLILYSFFQLFILQNQLDNTRISGIFGTESVQGSFLLRIVPIFIILYYYNNKYLNKSFHYLFYSILILSFFLIILSGERAAIFLTFLGFFLLFIFFKMSLKKIFFFSMLILSTFCLTIFFNPPSKERIFIGTYQQLLQANSAEKKIYIFSEGHQHHFTTALIIFKNYYIKGVGVRNFRMECRKDIYKKVGTYYCTTHPHNTYMQLLSETGLVGLLFVMSFLIFIFKQVYKFLLNVYIKQNKVHEPLGFALIIIIINFFPFITTGSFFNNWLSALYFLPIGFLLHELNCKKN